MNGEPRKLAVIETSCNIRKWMARVQYACMIPDLYTIVTDGAHRDSCRCGYQSRKDDNVLMCSLRRSSLRACVQGCSNLPLYNHSINVASVTCHRLKAFGLQPPWRKHDMETDRSFSGLSFGHVVMRPICLAPCETYGGTIHTM